MVKFCHPSGLVMDLPILFICKFQIVCCILLSSVLTEKILKVLFKIILI